MHLDELLASADMTSEQFLRPDQVEGKDGRILLDSLSPDQLDSLPFGAIQLNEEGTILQYNEYESHLAQIVKSSAIGKNFFTDIAPCTNVAEFRGRFTAGVAKGRLHAKFQFYFAFKENPRDVTVSLFYSGLTHSTWVFVRPA